jgi:hypothetical protein
MTRINVTRTTFKPLNKLMLLEWRLGLGPWMNKYPDTVGRIMVLTTNGTKLKLVFLIFSVIQISCII